MEKTANRIPVVSYRDAECLGEGGGLAPGMGVTVFAFDFMGSGKSESRTGNTSVWAFMR